MGIKIIERKIVVIIMVIIVLMIKTIITTMTIMIMNIIEILRRYDCRDSVDQKNSENRQGREEKTREERVSSYLVLQILDLTWNLIPFHHNDRSIWKNGEKYLLHMACPSVRPSVYLRLNDV